MQLRFCFIFSLQYIFFFYYTAVRSGDYYMFDEFDDTDVHLKDDESSSDEDAPKSMGFGKVSQPLLMALGLT